MRTSLSKLVSDRGAQLLARVARSYHLNPAPAVANSATSELARPIRRAFMRTSFRKLVRRL
jgi:hypothetical protein